MPEQNVLLDYEVEAVKMGLLDFIRTKGKALVYDNHCKVTCPKCGGLNVTAKTSFPMLTCCNLVVRIQND